MSVVRLKSNGKDLRISKRDYYLIGEIEESKVYKYNFKEATYKMLETGVWGPWDLKTKY